MKATSSLLAFSSLLTVLGTATTKAQAQSDQVALNFELPPTAIATPAETTALIAPLLAPLDGPAPLAIPPGAGNPPMRFHQAQQLPSGVYRQAIAAGLNAGNSPATLLPPAPPLVRAFPVVAQKTVAETSQTAPEPDSRTAKKNTESEPIALSFDFLPLGNTAIAQVKDALQLPPNPLVSLFEGGTDSLVARAVGSAEGTRTPYGGITAAYYGHSDPGNGVWNMGTFSYQHGAKTAAEADQKQLERLLSQSQVLKRRAAQHGLNLTLEETLNGIDLANQSPLASIGRVGYVERLAEAHKMGYTGYEAIVIARTRSYLNPDTNRWNAPGLGNTLESITRDQRRRADAIARSIAVYQQENAHINWQQWALMPPADAIDAAVAMQPQAPAPEAEDIIFNVWTDEDDAKQTPVIAQAENSEGSSTASAASPGSERTSAGHPHADAQKQQTRFSVGVPEVLAKLADSLTPEDPLAQLRSSLVSAPWSAKSIPEVAASEAMTPGPGTWVAPGVGETSANAKAIAVAPVPPQPTAVAEASAPAEQTAEPGAEVAGDQLSDQKPAPAAAPNVATQLPLPAAATFSASLPATGAGATNPAQPESETGENHLSAVPLTFDQSQPPAAPSWVETREGNQTMAVQVDPNALQVTPPPASTSTGSPSPFPGMESQVLGSVPDTTVLQPLQEEVRPGAPSSRAIPEDLTSAAPEKSDQSPFAAPSLPEGLMNQLQSHTDLEQEDLATGTSLKEQVTEAILGVDLSAFGQP